MAQEFTIKYGLTPAISKNLTLTNLGALNEKEANRYFIYQTILDKLPQCKSLDDLKELLEKKNIQTLYKYKGQTNELQGISFKIGQYKYKGSEIDRNFSVKNLEKAIEQHQVGRQSKQTIVTPNSSLLLQNKQPEIEKQKSQKQKINEQLIRPEHTYKPSPSQWKFDRKRKKNSRRLHL